MKERSIRQCASKPTAAGFTILELIVVVAILAILLMLGIPSFQGLLQRNRVAGEVNSFVSDVQLARSEAIKRGTPVGLCASADSTTCLGANRWHQGWIVFSDPSPAGTLSASSVVIRARAAFKAGDTFVSSPAVTFVTFSRDGFAMNLAAFTMPLHTTPVNDQATRCVTLNMAGHQAVQTVGAVGASACT